LSRQKKNKIHKSERDLSAPRKNKRQKNRKREKKFIRNSLIQGKRRLHDERHPHIRKATKAHAQNKRKRRKEQERKKEKKRLKKLRTPENSKASTLETISKPPKPQ